MYKSVEQGRISWAEYIAPMDTIQKQALSTYQKAFDDRCKSGGNAVRS